MAPSRVLEEQLIDQEIETEKMCVKAKNNKKKEQNGSDYLSSPVNSL